MRIEPAPDWLKVMYFTQIHQVVHRCNCQRLDHIWRASHTIPPKVQGDLYLSYVIDPVNRDPSAGRASLRWYIFKLNTMAPFLPLQTTGCIVYKCLATHNRDYQMGHKLHSAYLLVIKPVSTSLILGCTSERKRMHETLLIKTFRVQQRKETIHTVSSIESGVHSACILQTIVLNSLLNSLIIQIPQAVYARAKLLGRKRIILQLWRWDTGLHPYEKANGRSLQNTKSTAYVSTSST